MFITNISFNEKYLNISVLLNISLKIFLKKKKCFIILSYVILIDSEFCSIIYSEQHGSFLDL